MKMIVEPMTLINNPFRVVTENPMRDDMSPHKPAQMNTFIGVSLSEFYRKSRRTGIESIVVDQFIMFFAVCAFEVFNKETAHRFGISSISTFTIHLFFAIRTEWQIINPIFNVH
jgi:hypothetical protein